MLINEASLRDVFIGFQTAFNRGLEGVTSHHGEIAMTVPSNAREENYGWLGQFPKLREWIGDRVVRSLSVHGYSIPNRRFELTVAVKRTDIEDDRYGVYAPMMEEMGRSAAEHPNELVFSLLAKGFETPGYDGQPFFDHDHPVGTEGGDYPVRSASNMQDGDGPAWFLLDCRRAMRPLVFQRRMGPDFQFLDSDRDENVFWRDEFVYGVRARSNAGFGLWQLAFGSKAPLTFDNYTEARLAMRTLRGDEGRVLGIRPTHLVVPAELEREARLLIENEQRVIPAGEDQFVAVANEWRGSVHLIVTEWLSA